MAKRASYCLTVKNTLCTRHFFCGNTPEQTANALLQVLRQNTQFTGYMLDLLHQLVASTGLSETFAPTISLKQHPFWPKDIQLPQDSSGCCYLLISCQDPTATYIGQTRNLPEQLRQHNSGCGSNQTQSLLLQPWALFGYVVGFGGSVQKLQNFEKAWQEQREYEKRRLHRNLSPHEIASCAVKLMHTHHRTNDSSLTYRYIQACAYHGQ